LQKQKPKKATKTQKKEKETLTGWGLEQNTGRTCGSSDKGACLARIQTL
jgi:hypothetical protein